MIGDLLLFAYAVGFGFHLHVEYEDPANDSSHLLRIGSALVWPLVWCALGVVMFFDGRGE